MSVFVLAVWVKRGRDMAGTARIRLVTVGRRVDPLWAQLAERYRRRLPAGWQWEWIRVPEVSAAGRAAEEVRRLESTALLQTVDRQTTVVALDERGEEVDTPGLVRYWRAWREAQRPVALLVGGAYGLSADVLARADWVWSLSRLTWPHDMVPVLVAEQLYRAHSIAVGHPYHKA
jgi:23S rRNA (pseudouridine1915-N3)-methyltransferase